MTTLVTGATGFIGANVVRVLLDAGASVRVLTRHGSDTRNLTGLPVAMAYGDVRDIASLRPALQGCDTLYHVAAHYSLWTPQPDAMYATNVQGTTNLLQVALELGIQKVIYTSSVATIRIPDDGSPGDETMYLAPEHAIGRCFSECTHAGAVAADSRAVVARGRPRSWPPESPRRRRRLPEYTHLDCWSLVGWPGRGPRTSG